jgi:hypothetical protein
VADCLATLDEAAFGAATEVEPKFVSPSDPAAQWTGAHKGPAFFVYADNYLIDVRCGVIIDFDDCSKINIVVMSNCGWAFDRSELPAR